MPVGAATQGAGAGDAAHWQALTRDTSLQFHFPDADINAKPPGWLTHLLEFLSRHGKEIGWLGWALLAIIVAVALWFLVRRLLAQNPSQKEGPAAAQMAPWQPSARQARLVLADADALAAQNRFDEAVHLLLLVSIQEIADRRHGVVTPALTSREIATLPVLSPLAQRIFSAIAQLVERTRFAGHVLGDAEFRACRAAYEQFTLPGTWQMAA